MFKGDGTSKQWKIFFTIYISQPQAAMKNNESINVHEPLLLLGGYSNCFETQVCRGDLSTMGSV